MKTSNWVAVEVECPVTGIRGVHYVETPGALCHPLAWAERHEREAGYTVLGSWLWS